MKFIGKIIFLTITAHCIYYQIDAAGAKEMNRKEIYAQWFDAAKKGNSEIIEKLMSRVNINEQDDDGNNALILASYFGHTQIVKLLLQDPKKININLRNKLSSSALFAAACQNHEDALRLLLEFPGVNVNAQNKQGNSGLIIAASNGHENIAKLLLQSPSINVNMQNEHGTTPLITAVCNERENIVKLLLQHPNVNVNIADSDDVTALIFAVEHDLQNIVKLLLNAPHVNINAQTPYGVTALIYAINKNNIEIVKLFLQRPDLDINAGKSTALVCAALSGRKEILKLLLEHPAVNINAQYKTGITALKCTKDASMAKLIQDKINELTHKAFDSISAFAQANSDAERQDNLQILKSVIAQIGDNIVDAEGNMLIDKAFTLNQPKIIEYLLTKAKNPCELLARFPFETLNPNSELFKYFFNLAYKKLCANPACKNQTTECTKKCSGCRKVYYCSVDCQKAQWETHKNACKKV